MATTPIKNYSRTNSVMDQLFLFGLPSKEIMYIANETSIQIDLLEKLKSKSATIVFQPSVEFFEKLGISARIQHDSASTFVTKFAGNSNKSWCFKTLHSYFSYSLDPTLRVATYVENDKGDKVWFSFVHNEIIHIVVGTNLSDDLILYRQGNPVHTHTDAQKSAWGFEFERPNYLYDQSVNQDNTLARPVDSWMLLLIKIIKEKLNIQTDPILPNNAKGAIILTGDDDQARLEYYDKQLSFIGKTPITYFMHPKTKVTRRFLNKYSGTNAIELGIHPDALHRPKMYKPICFMQTMWFMRKFFKKPFSVRNHGFLNDGYWGHLPIWQSLGINFSSNIPGFDGSVLTGSLIPSPIVYNNSLTNHWSLLTSFGDGMVFSDQYNEASAEKKIFDFADEMCAAEMPGVIVFNLHPDNFDQTKRLHGAVLDLIKQGFHAFTMKECFNWFNNKLTRARSDAQTT